MTNELAKIRFMAANYSKLQGLRVIPVGLFVLFTAMWNNAGLQGDLSGLFYSLIGFALLTRLADRYYVTAYGQVQQTPTQRKRDLILSVISIVLALPADDRFRDSARNHGALGTYPLRPRFEVSRNR